MHPSMVSNMGGGYGGQNLDFGQEGRRMNTFVNRGAIGDNIDENRYEEQFYGQNGGYGGDIGYDRGFNGDMGYGGGYGGDIGYGGARQMAVSEVMPVGMSGVGVACENCGHCNESGVGVSGVQMM